MDVRITTVDKDTVNKIDKIARERGFSRNHYLRQTLEQLPCIKGLESIENNYINVIKRFRK